MDLQFHDTGAEIIVSGKTFPYRAELRNLGGVFDPENKAWKLPASAARAAELDAFRRRFGAVVGEGSAVLPTAPSEPQVVLRPVPASRPPMRELIPFHETFESSPRVPASVPSEEVPLGAAGLVPNKEGLSVSELVAQVAGLVKSHYEMPLWIVGEVQNLGTKKTGIFFSLGDGSEVGKDQCTLNATLWHSSRKMIEAKLLASVDGPPPAESPLHSILAEGMQIRVLAKVEVYKGRGQITLSVIDIDPEFTAGKLALAREKLLAELRAKGLDRLNKSRPLALWPLRIGLISATGSRAYGDFTHQLYDGGFPGMVIFAPTTMQGPGTTPAVVKAINELVLEKVDLIVLTRGGGSSADLAWFDAREIAMAISACPVPILSAIGHHDDRSIAEEISFAHLKTPTAAAAFILDRFQTVKAHLLQASFYFDKRLKESLEFTSFHTMRLSQQLSGTLRLAIEAKEGDLVRKRAALSEVGNAVTSRSAARLEDAARRIEFQAASALTHAGQRLARISHDLGSLVERSFMQKRHELDMLKSRLNAADVRPWLNLGWTRLQREKTTILSIHDVVPDELLTAVLKDGKLRLRVS